MNEYHEFVSGKVKNGEDILSSLTGWKCHLWHMATGLSGEVGELVECLDSTRFDQDNLIEELGDLEFYLAGIRLAVGLTEEQFFGAARYSHDVSKESLMLRACVISGGILDLTKKHVVYTKDLYREKIIENVYEFQYVLGLIYSKFGLQRDEIQMQNKIKLTERYGEKYSDAAAIARADKNDASE